MEDMTGSFRHEAVAPWPVALQQGSSRGRQRGQRPPQVEPVATGESRWAGDKLVELVALGPSSEKATPKSARECRQSAAAIFHAFDWDRSGALEREELQLLLLYAGVSRPEAEAEALLDSA